MFFWVYGCMQCAIQTAHVYTNAKTLAHHFLQVWGLNGGGFCPLLMLSLTLLMVLGFRDGKTRS